MIGRRFTTGAANTRIDAALAHRTIEEVAKGFGGEELTPLGKAATVLLLIGCVISALHHLSTGNVPTPGAFLVTVVGFLLFSAAKLSVIARGRWVSFGTAAMSASFANAYRLGYWLMVFGLVATFAG